MPEQTDIVRGALASQIADATCAAMAPFVEVRSLSKGEPLIREDWGTDVLYTVMDGSLEVVLEEPEGRMLVGQIGRGTFVGEASFLDQGAPTATVRATTACRLLTLRRADFEKLCVAHPKAGADLIRALCVVLAKRVNNSASGLLEQVSEETFNLRQPEVRTGPFAQLLARLSGGRHRG